MARNELRATPQDLVSCYRIFLNREPDKAGLKMFGGLVEGGISTTALAKLLQNSTEAQLVRSAQETGALSKIDLDGFSLFVLPDWNPVGGEIAATQDYEPHISTRLKTMIEPGMHFVDIGANIGFYSMLAASKGATVDAFEPHSRNVWFLQKNAALNNFAIDIHPGALADAERFFLYSPNGGNGQISPLTDTIPTEEQQIIKAQTLDVALNGKRPSMIKIDVEGAEGLVMRGAQQALDALPIVISEFSAVALDNGPVSSSEYLAMFVSRGYHFVLCHRDGTQQMLSADDLRRASDESQNNFVDFMAIPA